MTVLVGDCREMMRTMADNSVDAIITDPPYELGFMGKSWDSTGVAYDVTVWQECLRVLKPGGHLLAFGGSRTYHRLAVAIEDAGFQIRDQIMWVYGSGFPKSLDVSKAIDKTAGAERKILSRHPQPKGKPSEGWGHKSEAFITSPSTDAAKQWDGWGTALKPAHEPIVLARKPLDGTVANNVLTHGVGGINIDGCRVDNEDTRSLASKTALGIMNDDAWKAKEVMAGSANGRFPANFIHDGSDEVLELFPDTKSTRLMRGDVQGKLYEGGWSGNSLRGHNDSGSAARFFYCAKANKKDRNEGLDKFAEKREADRIISDGVGGDNPRNRSNKPKLNHHPTVKPTELMRYLCRLITPPNGTVLDPFTGSGSTGKAATLERFNFIGIEQSAEYAEIAKARINHAKETQ